MTAQAQRILDEINNDPFLANLARELISPDIGEAASHLAMNPEEMESLRSYTLCGDTFVDVCVPSSWR